MKRSEMKISKCCRVKTANSRKLDIRFKRTGLEVVSDVFFYPLYFFATIRLHNGCWTILLLVHSIAVDLVFFLLLRRSSSIYKNKEHTKPFRSHIEWQKHWCNHFYRNNCALFLCTRTHFATHFHHTLTFPPIDHWNISIWVFRCVDVNHTHTPCDKNTALSYLCILLIDVAVHPPRPHSPHSTQWYIY